MKNRAKLNTGFTLLEVMVALFVVAIALGGAIKVVGNAAQNSAHLSNRTFAQWIGSNQMAKLQTEKAWPKLGETKGESEMAKRKWKWLQKIIKTEDKRIKRVEIAVTPEGEEGPIATIVGFLAQP